MVEPKFPSLYKPKQRNERYIIGNIHRVKLDRCIC